MLKLFSAKRLLSSQRNILFQKFDNAILSRSVNAEKGLQLFYICKEQCESNEWFKSAKLPENFHGKHGLLMLHVWMINKRLLLLPDTKARQEIQETLFDTLWNDTMARIRSAGITEISVNARLKDVQAWSLPTCMELDYAFSIPTINESKDNSTNSKSFMQMKSNISPKENEIIKEHPDIRSLSKKQIEELVIDHISGTLWRQIYQRNEFISNHLNSTLDKEADKTLQEASSAISTNDTSPAIMEQIIINVATYIYHEYSSLAYDITDYIFENALFRFGIVPSNFASDDSTNNIIQSRNTPNPNDEIIMFENGKIKNKKKMYINASPWRETMHIDGKLYYYNVVTDESQWEKPKDRI